MVEVKLLPLARADARAALEWYRLRSKKAAAGFAAALDVALRKIADYFQAGTKIVWDVDPLAETIAEYQGDAKVATRTWKRGDTADAEPVLPGWRITVDEVFVV